MQGGPLPYFKGSITLHLCHQGSKTTYTKQLNNLFKALSVSVRIGENQITYYSQRITLAAVADETQAC